jgi:hypothetical protein
MTGTVSGQTVSSSPGVPVAATAVVNPRRSVSDTLPTGGGGGGASGVIGSPISIPTQPPMEKKKNETDPQNLPLRLTRTLLPSSQTVATIEPRADTETTTRLSSPLTMISPLSRNGLVPKPTRILAEASSLIGPADQLICQPAPNPAQNPSKLKSGSFPSRWSFFSSIIR